MISSLTQQKSRMAYLYQNRNVTGDDAYDNDLMMIMMTLMLDA